jgi:hypothetical protein
MASRVFQEEKRELREKKKKRKIKNLPVEGVFLVLKRKKII